MPTLRSIAAELELSLSTVSLALKGSGVVSAATRDRVRAHAERVGYRRRPRGRPSAASRLSIACFHRGGLDASGPGASLLAENLRGVEQEAKKLQLRLKLFDAAGMAGPAVQAGLDRAIEGGHADAVILLAVDDLEPFARLATGLRVPVIAVNRRPPFGEFGFVEHDNFGGSVLAADELHRRGCARPALVSADEDFGFLAARREGFRRRLRLHHRLELVAEEKIAPTAHPFDPGRYAARDDRLVQRLLKKGVDGVFAPNFFSAWRVAAAAERAGVGLPDPLSVVGFDPPQMPTPGGRRVSSVAFDSVRLGRLAVRLIARNLLKPEDPTVRLRGFSVRTTLRFGDT